MHHYRNRVESPHFQRTLLLLAFLLPNVLTLSAGFIYDDVPLLVQDATMHSVDGLTTVWTEPFWPDRPLLTLYRPLTKSIWILLWVAGNGSPILFHLANLLLGSTCVLLLHQYLRSFDLPPLTPFLAAFLFALFPIHSEAVAPAFGMAELLAGTFGLAALLLHRHGRRASAIILFALAILSKESAAAIAAIGFLAAPPPRRRFLPDAIAAALVVAAALFVRAAVANEITGIPAADNPASLQNPLWRVITALWVQCLYVWKTLVPVDLAIEYGYRQIPLVVRLGDPRALAGLALLGGSLVAAWRRREYAPGILAWWLLFLPAANLLYPIGTIMAERLAYLPSAGAAFVAAVWLGRRKSLRSQRSMMILMVILFALYGGRTFSRNLVWNDTDRFYDAIVADAPQSARAWFGRGTYLAAEGRDSEATDAYERATQILPTYAEAHFNRANALVRLGRNDEAIEAYQRVARLVPGQTPAEQNMLTLLSGGKVETKATTVD